MNSLEPLAGPDQLPVVAVVVTSEQGVLVIRRRDGRPPWGFIAGKIELGESPAEAAEREVREEAGLNVAADREISRRVHPETGRAMIYMAARVTGSTRVQVEDQDELLGLQWVALEEARSLLPTMHEPVADYLARVLGSGT